MKKILAVDRDDFAKATDDYNSVHFGPEGIAHGCHVLGWAVGQLVEDGDIISAIEVMFLRPVPIGSKIELREVERGVERVRQHITAAVYVGGVKAVGITLWRKARAQNFGD